MKRFMFFMLILLVMSTTAIAQTMVFDVFRSTVTNQSNGESASLDVDFQILIDDYHLVLGTAKTYTFTGDIVSTTTKQFYVYAIDGENGSKCRIWFTALGGQRANLDIEYSDFSFQYKTNRIK